MSAPGRGRGYTGRHHVRDQRPGDSELHEQLEAAKTLTELSPRAPVTENSKPDLIKVENKKDFEAEQSEEKQEMKPEKKFPIAAEDEAALLELLTIDEQFAPLLNLLEQFSPMEDGIQFNRKLRQFESTITTMCPDDARLQEAFASFRAAALQHPARARQLAAVGASFTRQQRQQRLRCALLNVCMQGTYCKLDLLERSNPMFLINAANLMGDYFAEARLCNGDKVHILAAPLLHYLRALLAADDLRAHRTLATQLMQNGRELLSVLASELDELSISIRLRLLSPPPVSAVWLLLSADLCLNRFLPLPNTLQQFYAAHLELSADENYSEVSYGSWKKSPEKDKSETLESENISQNVSQISLEDGDAMKPKLRPILGAGAGLMREKQTEWSLNKTSLTKRYDLNSWRQDEEKQEEEPIFNPAVLPPNFNVPDFPPPNVRYAYAETFPNYLQHGDGSYIQNPMPQNQMPHNNFNPQGDGLSQQYVAPKEPVQPEKINNEIQKTSNRRPVENWRQEKTEQKEDPNKSRQRNWNRSSVDNDNDDNENDKKAERHSRDVRPGNRQTRRNSSENTNSGLTPTRKHAMEPPRNHRYWDHDDRCDKDYSS